MTRNINQQFEYHGEKYVVTEADVNFPYKCVCCGFYDHVDCKCRGPYVTGDCRRIWRDDHKEVFFKEL